MIRQVMSGSDTGAKWCGSFHSTLSDSGITFGEFSGGGVAVPALSEATGGGVKCGDGVLSDGLDLVTGVRFTVVIRDETAGNRLATIPLASSFSSSSLLSTVLPLVAVVLLKLLLLCASL